MRGHAGGFGKGMRTASRDRTNSHNRDRKCCPAWFCLFIVFFLAHVFSFFFSCVSYVEFRMGFVMWSICVVTGDTICQCGIRGIMKPLGSDTVGKRKRERERERKRLWQGRMTERCCVRISRGPLTKCWAGESECAGKTLRLFLCVWC